MRIAILSDLHLGVRDSADRFGHDPRDVARFLDALERQVDRVIVNGDLYETWQGRRFGRPAEAFEAVGRAWPHLTARLHEPPYALTWGNHDPILADHGAARQIEIDADGVRLLFTHGHRFDPLLKRTRPLAYTFSWTTGWLHRHPDAPVAAGVNALRGRFERRHLYNVEPSAALDHPDEANCPYQRGAARMLKARPSLSLVAFGHTHVPALTQTPWGIYVNSGAMAGGCFTWVLIDTRERACALLRDEPVVERALDALESGAAIPLSSTTPTRPP